MNRSRLLMLILAFVMPFAATRALAGGQIIYVPPGVTTIATPAALGHASTAVPDGTPVWVTNQGVWRFGASCPTSSSLVCDDGSSCTSVPPATMQGCSCVFGAAGDGGRGCYVRGAEGLPGAGGVMDWYVSSIVGSDLNDCLTPETPCLTIEEVHRRVGPQHNQESDDFGSLYPIVYLHGDFPGTHHIGFPSFYEVVGTRVFTTADGGPIFNGTISTYTAWDGPSHQIGTMLVPGLADAGLTTNGGYMLEVQDGGSNPGLGVIIGPQRKGADGGLLADTFATPGGAIPGSFWSQEPASGDVVRAYRTTSIAGDVEVSYSAAIITGGGIMGVDLTLGSVTHSVSLSPAGLNTGNEFDSCIIHGIDLWGITFGYGDAFLDHPHVYGRGESWTGCLMDQAQMRNGVGPGMLELSGNDLVGVFNSLAGDGSTIQGILLGSRDGPGLLWVDGPTAVLDYAQIPCLGVYDGSKAILSDAFWCDTALDGQPAIKVTSGGLVMYTTTPAVVGTAAANKWLVGGTASNGSLPIAPSATNGAGIVVYQ